MPRIRTIKPEFWRNRDLAILPEFTRLLAIAVLNLADDEGYFEADARLVRGDVFPYDEDSRRTHGGLTELSRIGYITIRTSKTKGEIGLVCNFKKHQVINRPTPSKLKAEYIAASRNTNDLIGGTNKSTQLTEDSLSDHGGLTEEAVLEEEQGTGKGNREEEQGSIKEKGDSAKSPFLQNPEFAQVAADFRKARTAKHGAVSEEVVEAWYYSLNRFPSEEAIEILRFSTACEAKTPITNGDHKAKPPPERSGKPKTKTDEVNDIIKRTFAK